MMLRPTPTYTWKHREKHHVICSYLVKSGTLLAAVAQPIRDYLRQRPDTIRCLVNMVTSEGDLGSGGDASGASLPEELQKHRVRQADSYRNDVGKRIATKPPGVASLS